MKSRLHSVVARTALQTLLGHRRAGLVALIVLASILLCGATAHRGSRHKMRTRSHTAAGVAGFTIQPGSSERNFVLVQAFSRGNTIEGCVSAGPNGLEVLNLKDHKVYALAGATATTKAGDVVRLHGTRETEVKGGKWLDGGTDPTFVVQQVTRDFGPCKLSVLAVADTGIPSEAQNAQ
jgi:hypothetical protein